MQKLRPYIGITDFTSFEQVHAMLQLFVQNQPATSRHKLHVGVMMSYKTLNNIETKWSKAFPPKDSIAGIFRFSQTYNCLHYADYDHDTDFCQDLARAVACGGYGVHAVQLDMVWPDPAHIFLALLLAEKKVEVILQVGKNAIELCGNDPARVVERLEDYEGVIHRVLLDKSMGRGLGMDAEGLIPYARAIRSRFPGLGIGAAGGLGPKSIGLVEPLVREFPDLSIDAQGQLRPSGNALDPIDLEMAGEYLVQALALLK